MNKTFARFLPILISVVIFIIPFIFIPSGKIIYNNDWEFLGLNPDKQLEFVSSSWSIYSQRYNLFQSRYVTYKILDVFYNLLGKNFSLYQKFIIGMIMSSQFLAFYYFLSTFLKTDGWLRNVIALFYTFNLATLTNWHFGYIQILLMHTLIPLFITLLYRLRKYFFLSKRVNFIYLLLLSYLTPMMSLIIPDISILLLLIPFITTLYFLLPVKFSKQEFLFVGSVTIFLLLVFVIPNLYWIVNYFYFWKQNLSLLNTVTNPRFFDYNSINATILYVIRGLGDRLLDNQNRYFIQLFKIYNNNLIIFFIGICVFVGQVVVLFLINLRKENKRIISILFLSYIIFIGFITGFNKPFGIINKLLYDLGFYKFFRHAYVKTATLFYISFLSLTLLSLNQMIKGRLYILFLTSMSFLLFYLLWPFVIGRQFFYKVIEPNPTGKDLSVNSLIEIPGYYNDLEKIIMSNKNLGSILYLPIGDVYYTYKWGYGGASIIKYFLPTGYNIYGQYDHTNKINEIRNGKFQEIWNTDISYVLYDKSIEESFFSKRDIAVTNALVDFLYKDHRSTLIKDTKNYVIFKLLNHPKIEILDESVVNYEEINPSFYKLRLISSAKERLHIRFYNNFDNQWILQTKDKNYFPTTTKHNYMQWTIKGLVHKDLKITYLPQLRFQKFIKITYFYYIFLIACTIGLIFIQFKKRLLAKR